MLLSLIIFTFLRNAIWILLFLAPIISRVRSLCVCSLVLCGVGKFWHVFGAKTGTSHYSNVPFSWDMNISKLFNRCVFLSFNFILAKNSFSDMLLCWICVLPCIGVLDGIASLHGMKKNYELNGTVMIITLLNCISHLPFLPVVMLYLCVKCSKYISNVQKLVYSF